MRTREKAFVVCMCIAIASMTSNFAIMATFFPVHMAALGMSPYVISMIFTAFEMGRLAGGAIGGALASRFGRRAVLAIGMIVASTCGMLIGIVPDLSGADDIATMAALFIASRGLQGGGVALATVSIFATLSDAFPNNRGLVVGSASSSERRGIPTCAPCLLALSLRCSRLQPADARTSYPNLSQC